MPTHVANQSSAAVPSVVASEPSKTWYIYCIQCQVNSRRYIGSTTNMRRRYGGHRRNPPSRMRHDARLYQPLHSNFLMTELDNTDSKHKADQLEYHYIRLHVTQASQGYNIAKQDPTHSRQFWYLHKCGCT